MRNPEVVGKYIGMAVANRPCAAKVLDVKADGKLLMECIGGIRDGDTFMAVEPEGGGFNYCDTFVEAMHKAKEAMKAL